MFLAGLKLTLYTKFVCPRSVLSHWPCERGRREAINRFVMERQTARVALRAEGKKLTVSLT
jgi:hypothetical protein